MSNDQSDDTRGLALAGYGAILFCGLLAAVATDTMIVALPTIAEHFSSSASGVQIKMMVTALGLGMMVGAPFAGETVARIGCRLLLAVSILVFGLLGCAMFFMDEVFSIIVARFFIGVATGAISVSVATLIAQAFVGNRQSRWIGLSSAVPTFAALILNPLAGALADRGWNQPFLLYACAAPVLVLVLAGVPSALGRKEPERLESPGTTNAVETRGLSLMTLGLALIVGTLTTGTSLYWPFRLQEVGVDSARDIALYGLPNILLTGVLALSYGACRRRLSIRQIFLISGLMSALGLGVMSLADRPAMVILGLAIEGCAIGLLIPNLTNFAIIVSAPSWRSRNLGLAKGVFYGSPFITQFVIEPINQLAGSAWALAAIGLLGLLIVVAMAAQNFDGRSRKHSTA